MGPAPHEQRSRRSMRFRLRRRMTMGVGAGAVALALVAAGCSSSSTNGGSSSSGGTKVMCPSALNALSFHGPSTMLQIGEPTYADMFLDWESRYL